MKISRILLVLTVIIVSGCSDSEDKGANQQSTDDHVLKTQTDALEKAKQTEQLIMDASEQQKQKIDEQSH
jgi:outer membrane murein-binding lipoprotein Lpp